MLEITGLQVRYGRITAISDIALTVNEGEAVGVVGPNGAGKSSLLNTVTGVVKPVAGTIRFKGESILDRKPEDIVRSGLVLVPEGRRIFGPLSVEENLRLGATPLMGGRKDEIESRIEAMLDRFPALKRLYNAQAGNLSGGEQQMLAIARALMSDPEMLLLDEPSLGLAPLIVDEVFEILAGLRETGVSILLVEQNALKTVEFCDRTYVMRLGRFVTEGSREELLAHEDFSTAYLGM